MIFIFGEVVRVAACGGPLDERMRIAGLRWREAAARATQTSRRRNACFMKKIVRHATERKRGLASQTGGCRKRFHSFFFLAKEKCGMTRMGFVFWSAVRRRRRTCTSLGELQSAAWGGGELRGSKSHRHHNGKVFGSQPAESASELSRTPAGLRGARLRPARLCESPPSFNDFLSVTFCSDKR